MNKKKLSLSTHVASLATTSLLNGRTQIACLLGIGMLFTLGGCQKEAEEDWLPVGTTSYEAQSVAHICYHLDDEVYHVTTDGDAALSDLMRYLCDQARQGRRVKFYDEDKVSAIASKDRVTYETKSEEEIIKWGKQMELKGYFVEYTFDKDSGTFTGIAQKL